MQGLNKSLLYRPNLINWLNTIVQSPNIDPTLYKIGTMIIKDVEGDVISSSPLYDTFYREYGFKIRSENIGPGNNVGLVLYTFNKDNNKTSFIGSLFDINPVEVPADPIFKSNKEFYEDTVAADAPVVPVVVVKSDFQKFVEEGIETLVGFDQFNSITNLDTPTTSSQVYMFDTRTTTTTGLTHNTDFWGYNHRSLLDTTGISFTINPYWAKQAGYVSVNTPPDPEDIGLEAGLDLSSHLWYYGNGLSNPPTKWINGKTFYNLALVTPWHAITSTHTCPYEGSSIFWFDRNGTAVERKIQTVINGSSYTGVNKDWNIIKLDSPINSNLYKKYKLGIFDLSSDEPENQFPVYTPFGVTYFASNSNPVLNEWIRADSGLHIYTNKEITKTGLLSFSIHAMPLNEFSSRLPNIQMNPPNGYDSGDSSGPMMAFYNGELVIFGLTWTVDALNDGTKTRISGTRFKTQDINALQSMVDDTGNEDYSIEFVTIKN